jgi:hypothetical protein
MRALLLLLASCTTSIPDVEPAQFACEGDAPLASGDLPCPESHYCDDGRCRPRLDCAEEGALGCNVAEQRRCNPVLSVLTSAVECSGGNHTVTSTIPLDDQCSCPDQGPGGTALFCAMMATGPAAAYPLYLVAPGERLPIGMGGITGDVPEWRWCVRACGSELDCPASHTCRPANVVAPRLDARHTIGACYPNIVTATSTTVAVPQPDEDACLSNEDCPGDCQYNVEAVADHPVLPIGSSWARKALVARCEEGTGGLVAPGGGCRFDAECRNGICDEAGRCRQPCDPVMDTACDLCLSTLIGREIPGSDEVVLDYVHVCER